MSENDIQPGRYKLFEHGVLNWTLIVVILGAIMAQFWKPLTWTELGQLFKKSRARYFLFTLWLLIISPLPSALTLDGEVPNIHRTVIMSLCWAVVFSLAVYLIARLKLIRHWAKISLGLIGLLLLAETVYFWQYYTQLSYESSFIWRDEMKKDLVFWLEKNGADYDQIFLPGNQGLSIHYLFYTDNFSSDLIGKIGLKFQIPEIDKLNFVDADCQAEVTQPDDIDWGKRILIVSKAECDCVPQYLNVREQMERQNLTRGYYLAESTNEPIALEKWREIYNKASLKRGDSK